ncbi:MAG: PKD domain-containing protein, partial [Aquabacterium sp.]|nr:PKD domain-containing protein [Ferruginibacter sp.]
MLRSILILSFSFLSLFGVAQSADFSFQSSSGSFCNPVSVQFTQNCTGNPVGFVWDFGNNTRGFGGNVSATYNNAGTYTVKLTAIYDQLRIEVYKTVVINPGVSANLAFDRNYICQPGPVNFTASSSGNKVKYDWDFGDGATL